MLLSNVRRNVLKVPRIVLAYTCRFVVCHQYVVLVMPPTSYRSPRLGSLCTWFRRKDQTLNVNQSILLNPAYLMKPFHNLSDNLVCRMNALSNSGFFWSRVNSLVSLCLSAFVFLGA